MHQAGLDAGKDLSSRLDFAPVRDLNADINFEENKARLLLSMREMRNNSNLKDIHCIAGPPPVGLVDYVCGLCPVHCLNANVFHMVMWDSRL